NGIEFVNQTLRDYYEEVGISHETSVACSPQQNGVVERHNCTLIEAARTIKNLGKLQPKADIGIFIGYAPTKKAFRIYNRRTRRRVETIHVDFDELTAMASEQSSSGPALNDMTPGTISSGLMRTSSSSTSYLPPSRNDWDLLFQPMFDELLNPFHSVVNQAAEVIAPIAEVIPQVDVDSTGSPSSITVDQDAPSPRLSQNPKGIFINQSKYALESLKKYGFESCDLVDTPMVQPNHPMAHHNSKWMKDHPLNNIIGQLSRPVSTRLQLHEQALFCYYDAFLTSMEPKTYKEALTQACWIEAMQEELNRIEFLTTKLGMRSFTPETLKQLMNEENETIATKIEQQVALDEALVSSTKRLRIGRYLLSLRHSLLWQIVPEIYMQEFWATVYVHQHSIGFKMDSKKNIVDLEAFRDMLHISPRVPGQSFDELPFEE
nr:hypothetical protein [Tanacetum cinerariifolium]